MEKLGISTEHHSSVQGINRYLQSHRVNQLFNVSLAVKLIWPRIVQELMTNILNEKPADPKQAILKTLQSIQKKQFSKEDPHNNSLYQFQSTFLTTEDFEAIFDSYDVLQI